jgi:hypothetical protein
MILDLPHTVLETTVLLNWEVGVNGDDQQAPVFFRVTGRSCFAQASRTDPPHHLFV